MKLIGVYKKWVKKGRLIEGPQMRNTYLLPCVLSDFPLSFSQPSAVVYTHTHTQNERVLSKPIYIPFHNYSRQCSHPSSPFFQSPPVLSPSLISAPLIYWSLLSSLCLTDALTPTPPNCFSLYTCHIFPPIYIHLPPSFAFFFPFAWDFSPLKSEVILC